MDEGIMWHGDEPDPFDGLCECCSQLPEDCDCDESCEIEDDWQPESLGIADWIDEEQAEDEFLDAYMESRIGGCDYDY